MPHRDDYQQTMSDYAAQLRGLFAPVSGAAGAAPTVRGAPQVPQDVLASRATQFVAASQNAGQSSADLLDSADPAERDAAEVKLLAQAAAQLQVAGALLDAAATTSTAAGATTRGAGGGLFLQQSLNDAASLLETPVDQMPSLKKAMRGGVMRPTEPAAAKAGLTQEADTSVTFITREAGRVAGEVLRDLLLLDGATVLEGVRLVSKDAAGALDNLIAGAGNLLLQLATSAAQLVLQAYQWVVSLLGKDNASEAVVQANNWVGDLRQEAGSGDSGGPVDALLTKVYEPDAVEKDVSGWVDSSDAPADTLNKTADTVKGLADKYKARTGQVEKLLQAIALVRRVPLLAAPQGQALIAALNLGLFGYVIYTGYDHVDSGSFVFAKRFKVTIPHRVDGVRATVQKALASPSQSSTATPIVEPPAPPARKPPDQPAGTQTDKPSG